MARSLKTVGMRELHSLQRRTKRQYTLDRIGRKDHDEILELLMAVEAIVVRMHEVNENAEEEDFDD